MRRVLYCLSAILLCSHSMYAAPDAIRAGAAKSNITPALGSVPFGETSPPSTHIHDELWVRSLALDNGQTRIAIVVCDLVGVSLGLAREAKRMVRDSCGLPEENLVIAATHTHSAAKALGEWFDVKLSSDLDEYQSFVAHRVADSVRCALNNLEPAQIGWATTLAPDHVFNRRWFLAPGSIPVNLLDNSHEFVKMNPGIGNPNALKPAGPVDPQVFLVAARRPNGSPIATLSNYSLHYVGGRHKAHISADYYGMFNNRVKELLGADRQDPPFVSIMSNGTSGDINNINVAGPARKDKPYERMRLVADDLAHKVAEAYKTIEWHDALPLGIVAEEIELELRSPTPEELEIARKVFEGIPAGAEPRTLREIQAGLIVGLAGMPKTSSFPLQAINIGEIGIATFPLEVFCEIGLELKQRTPFAKGFVISLANGCYGYLPTPAQHQLGGYETWLGINRVETNASRKMIEQLLFMQTRLKTGVEK